VLVTGAGFAIRDRRAELPQDDDAHATEIAGHIVVFNARTCFEYDLANRFSGSTAIGSLAPRF
jgi:hypothetical protein